MSRKRGPVELPEFASMVRRIIRAFGARVADADPEDLAVMLAVRTELDAVILAAVYEQNQIQERSWAAIGGAAGITRQSAYDRWGKAVRERAETDPRVIARKAKSAPQNGTEGRSGIEYLQDLLSLEG